MSQYCLGRFIRIAALLLAGVATSHQALAQATARNATSVSLTDAGRPHGELRKVDATTWIETDTRGDAVFEYREVKRDDAIVHLADKSRDVTVQLDIKKRSAVFRDPAAQGRQTYQIKTVSDGAVQPMAAAPAAAPRPAAAKGAKVVAEATPGFCWSDTVTRGAGTIPGRVADCPEGYTLNGGSCKRAGATIAAPSRAADCPAGYNNAGASCERAAVTKPNANVRLADCPDGFKNTDGACFRLSAAAPLDASKMSCKAGETRIEARCFKGCEAGFTGSGATCTRPASTLGADNMTCKSGFQKGGKAGRCAAVCAAGFTNTGEACVKAGDTVGVDAMTCKAGETREAGRCLPAGGGCADGEVQQGDLCYKACGAGFDGVGSACIKQPPKAWMQCGTGAAKDDKACTAATFNQGMSVKQAAVLTGLAGTSRFGRERASTKRKFKDMVEAYNKAKDTPQFKKGFDAWEDAGKNAQGTRLAMDKLASASSEEDMVRYAAQVAQIAELSGAAADDAYPKCGAMFPAK